MKPWRRFLIRLAASVTRRRDEDRLREELEQHVALQTAEHIRAGLSPAEARRQALIKLGGAEAITDHYRDEQGLPILDNLVQDVRYTLRQLRKAPLFTLTATVSLAIGIGANAAVFAVIERVLLRQLPVDNPEQLVFVTDQRILTEESPRFSYPFYAALRDNGVLAGVAARASVSLSTTSNGQLARAAGELVSGNYFSVIGADVQMGRTFTSEDDRTPGAHAVAIISDGFWRRNFGSDPSVLGRDLNVGRCADDG